MDEGQGSSGARGKPVCLISCVHMDIRRDDPWLYEPDKVPIGPFHYWPSTPDDPQEIVKKDVMLRRGRSLLLPGDDQGPREQELNGYLELDVIRRMGEDARGCYGYSFSRITTENFKSMLLVDGCFLLSRFVLSAAVPVEVDSDIIFLLENQLPFFVLVEIQNLITPNNSNYGFVVDNVLRCIQALLAINEYSAVKVDRRSITHSPPSHLLHLLYMHFQPAPPPTPSPTTGQQVLRAVTSYYASGVMFLKQKIGGATPGPSTQRRGDAARQTATPVAADMQGQIHVQMPPQYNSQANWSAATYYYAAGVRFTPRKVGCGDGKASSILDVKLSGSTLHIPRLTVDWNTFRMLRNMVALEQQNKPRLRTSHVTAYCFFLSQLAGTERDVELLVAKKIIVHLFHNAKEVATGLSRLCDGVVIDPYDPDTNYLKTEQEALEKICRDGWMKSMAWLRHTKCNNYFMALAVVTAVVILLCTVEQSVFAAPSNFARGRN